MKKIIGYFLQGLLYTAPIGLTIYIIYSVFRTVDNLLINLIQEYLGINFPGLGFLVVAIFLVAAGILGQSIIIRPFRFLFKQLLNKVPLLNLIFSALNDLFSAFVGKEKKFNKPVVVLVNEVSNFEKLGFITNEDLTNFDFKDKVAVYFPHSYAVSGQLFIVPKKQVRPVDVNPAAFMKFIVSAGVSNLDEDIANTGEIEK